MMPRRPCIKLSRNGPCLVTIDDLSNAKGERLNGSRGVALCRCGASNTKPFCDASHIRTGFSDEPRGDLPPGDVGAGTGPGPLEPRIRIARNGPYEVQGCDLDIEGWREGAARERYALCRCGGSRTKPFCDGTHERIAFRDERN